MVDLIEVGQIVNTHGIRGEVKINPWTDDMEELLELDVFYLSGGKELHVTDSRIHKNCLIVRFREISDMNEAERYKGTTVYTEKVPLPEGRYYIADLIGMEVFEEGKLLGKIQDVFQTGANDVYDIKTTDGKSILIPVIPDVVLEVNVEEKRMDVKLPAGLLDAEVVI